MPAQFIPDIITPHDQGQPLPLLCARDTTPPPSSKRSAAA
ncbi:hypothetical protein CCACVL1_10544 [Corchorus capsularis]|uniref:Uncharacterized protein n=1 Tax=Corchorus capsularis TaxID=210143 RepID=A0A1R3IQZ6_COCAP|nr:hypothetical protein CCACVL1_10544 [Corchorus capsularis]